MILGWMTGALVNYLADVLPFRRRLVFPFCLDCEARQGLSNYLIWPRRCLRCGRLRSWRVWIVEFAYIGGTLWLWYSPPSRLGFFEGLVLLAYFGLIAIIDIEHRLILHPVSLVGVVFGIGVGIQLHGLSRTLIGGAFGFGLMLAFYFFGIFIVRAMTRWRGKTIEEEALGFGDVNLSGVLGLLLSWPGILLGIFLAVMSGGLVSFLYLLGRGLTRRYQAFEAIPYAPFLLLGAAWILFFPETVQALFTNIYSIYGGVLLIR